MSTLRGVPSAYAAVAPPIELRRAHRLMSLSRVLEERLIKMSKSSDGYFWIGGPGEEAFNVPLGLLVKKGHGLDHDFLHLHYRSSAIMLAMGMDPKDAIRQMASKATDPFSGGRNFVNHYSYRPWNVVPGTSTIETQYAIAPGTALAQLRHGGDGITIVNGGDAGTAEGDFATCLGWSSRPGRELPILILVTNNAYGISTPASEVHGDSPIARRADAFGIRWDIVNGNDLFESWQKLHEVMSYVRKERKPFCLEAIVGRLHGHSSSSGALRIHGEVDPIEVLERKMVADRWLAEGEGARERERMAEDLATMLHEVREEAAPVPESMFDFTFAGDRADARRVRRY
ncbi:MAG: thiamine pyrophosphate-dependent dehydrogenase E1 component subunit alpha [Deltaproteobacteria bacterium]|nr:thiamine pyrophosphate-dependent dehydrogenase E1 component subunit alpha [Deltaproteobacteria bacterium]